MSEVDIAIGQRWSDELAHALEETDVAIVVLTSENVDSAWIHFESGALSRTFDVAALMPYLVDIPPNGLSKPFQQFQAGYADRTGTFSLLRRLNSLTDRPMSEAAVKRQFAKRWPYFATHLKWAQGDRSTDASIPLPDRYSAHVIEFKDAVAYDLYLAARIITAQKEVCDLTWKDTLGLSHDLRPRRHSLRQYELAITRAAQRIVYREIFVFSDPRRVEKLKRRLAEKKKGYYCRYFDVSAAQIPRVQFALIDEIEVAFGGHGSNVMGVVVRSPELGRIMKAYFEDVWRRAIPIKEKEIDQAAVSKILRSGTGRLTPRRS